MIRIIKSDMDLTLILTILSLCDLQIITATHTNQCPAKFEANTNADQFSGYCSVKALPLDKIPEMHRDKICYSNCMRSSVCMYFRFSAPNACLVCLRREAEFDTHNVGSRLIDVSPSELPVAGDIVQSRIGLADMITANRLFQNCSSRLLGDNHIDFSGTFINSEFRFINLHLQGSHA